MNHARTIELMATVITKLQVPISLGHPLLVEVVNPWSDLRDELGIRGWATQEEAIAAIDRMVQSAGRS